MRKLIGVTIALLFASSPSFASIEVGMSYVTPLDGLSEEAGGGTSLYLSYEMPYGASDMSLIASLGAVGYGGLEVQLYGVPLVEYQWYSFPVNVGGRLYADTSEEKTGPFFEILGGCLLKMATIKVGGSDSSETKFSWNISPAVGGNFTEHFSAKMSYNRGADGWNWFGTHIAYTF